MGFINIEVDQQKAGYIIFEETDGKKYYFNLNNLASMDSEFAKVAYRYQDPFVLKRSVYHTMIPDYIVSFINWQDDSCDIPVSGFYFDYEDFFVPFLENIDS